MGKMGFRGREKWGRKKLMGGKMGKKKKKLIEGMKAYDAVFGFSRGWASFTSLGFTGFVSYMHI